MEAEDTVEVLGEFRRAEEDMEEGDGGRKGRRKRTLGRGFRKVLNWFIYSVFHGAVRINYNLPAG